MQLMGVCVVKNEADVIESFVRHNAACLDRLFVLDHGSADATVAILTGLAREGLPVTLLRSNAVAFTQHELMQQQVAHVFRTLGPDFVFLLDGDELIRAPSRDALEAGLRRLPPETPGSLRWQTYLPAPGDGPLLGRMRERPVAETNATRKVVLPRMARAQGSWQIAPGNHAARYSTDGGWHEPALVDIEGVTLAHFPLRSPEQALSKALIGWLGWRLAYGDLEQPGAERMGWHWRQWHEDFLRDGQLPSWDALRREALRVYAFDADERGFDASGVALVDDPLPLPPGFRGQADAKADPLRNLAGWSRALVDSLLKPARDRTTTRPR